MADASILYSSSFLLFDVTVSCEPMNGSEVTRQLLRRLAFNLRNFGLSENELKVVVVGLNFTVTGLRVQLTTTLTQLRSVPFALS